MNLLYGLLALYIWGLFCVLMIILHRIARFYQVTSGRRTYYRFFIVPIILVFLGGLRDASLGIFVGDGWGDLLMLAGGLSLIGLGYFLLYLMTGGRS